VIQASDVGVGTRPAVALASWCLWIVNPWLVDRHVVGGLQQANKQQQQQQSKQPAAVDVSCVAVADSANFKPQLPAMTHKGSACLQIASTQSRLQVYFR
jgi:hypothetical protein